MVGCVVAGWTTQKLHINMSQQRANIKKGFMPFCPLSQKWTYEAMFRVTVKHSVTIDRCPGFGVSETVKHQLLCVWYRPDEVWVESHKTRCLFVKLYVINLQSNLKLLRRCSPFWRPAPRFHLYSVRRCFPTEVRFYREKQITQWFCMIICYIKETICTRRLEQIISEFWQA